MGKQGGQLIIIPYRIPLAMASEIGGFKGTTLYINNPKIESQTLGKARQSADDYTILYTTRFSSKICGFTGTTFYSWRLMIE